MMKILLPIILVAISIACNNADFGGGAPSSSSEGGSSTQQIDETPVVPDDCVVDGDVVKIEPKAQTIKDCIAAAKIYHFDWQKCTDVPHATSYDCNFDSVLSTLSEKGYNTASLESAVDANAKLIACGEKNDGDTIIVQWWAPKDDECVFDGSDTTTACYRHYAAGEKPDDPTTDEEVRAAVRACIEG